MREGQAVQEAVRVEELRVPLDSGNSFFDGLAKRKAVVDFYVRYGQKPVWISNEHQVELADSLLTIVRNAWRFGLHPGRYHLHEFHELNGLPSKDFLIRREILLTDAFLALAADLKSGLSDAGNVHSLDSIGIGLLHDLIEDRNLAGKFASQEPRARGYRQLRKGLDMLIDSLQKAGNDSIENNPSVRLAAINLERWRRENVEPSQRYIFINIPSYTLSVVERDSVILSSRVIVGKPETETPIISSVIECFTVYPYWHVPRKIAVEEYLPAILKDSTFITRNNFDVLDRKGTVIDPDSVAWQNFHRNFFPVSLRQRYGSDNSLGIIKFIFDNPHAVYLHDTNAKRLFRNNDRAFSHGCIRMERAVELAHYLVTERVGSESTTIARYLNEEKQRWIELKKPIPIYTRYFTCEYKEGKLHFYKDVYQRDDVLYDLFDNMFAGVKM